MGILHFFKTKKQTASHLASLDVSIKELQKKNKKMAAELVTWKASVSAIQERHDEELQKGKQATDRALKLCKQMETAMEAALESLKTAEEIIIPGLVAANDTFTKAWDAQSSMSILRKVASENSGNLETE